MKRIGRGGVFFLGAAAFYAAVIGAWIWHDQSTRVVRLRAERAEYLHYDLGTFVCAAGACAGRGKGSESCLNRAGKRGHSRCRFVPVVPQKGYLVANADESAALALVSIQTKEGAGRQGGSITIWRFQRAQEAGDENVRLDCRRRSGGTDDGL